MTYDHAVTNQISSWIRNFTCSSAISQALIMYVALGFKIMTLTSIQHTGTLIFFPQRLMVGCFQAFDSIFPLGRRPPIPQPPNNTPRNSCIPSLHSQVTKSKRRKIICCVFVFFMQFSDSAKFTHYLTASYKCKVASISSCFLDFGIH